MKKALLIAVTLLAANPFTDPVHAAGREETYCHSTGIADGGYVFTIAPDFRTAVLAEQSFMGPRNHINMHCVQLPVRRFPDALNNYLVCKDPRNVRGGGMIVRMWAGGIAGLHYASVRSNTVGGGEAELEYGRLNCQR